MKLLRVGSALLLAAALLLAPRPAEAAVTVRYQLNFGGNGLHEQSWNSLSVTVKNDQGADLAGTVEVVFGGRYVQDLFVEAGREFTVRFYLPPLQLHEFFLGRNLSGIEVIVRDERGREIATTSVRTGQSIPPQHRIGVMSGDVSGYQRLSNVGFPGSVVELKPWHLDNACFMENFSVLIFGDGQGVSLTANQKDNLQTWVERGGLLIIGGGTRWQQNQALVPASLLPMTASGLTEVDGVLLPSLPQANEMAYPVATGAIRGQVVLAAGDIPIMVESDFGRGSVIYSALDLEAAPLDGADNFEAYVGYMIQWGLGSLAPPRMAPINWSVAQAFNTLIMDTAGLSPMSPGLGLAGLLAYIVLAGPVNYLVLKRLRRWEWAWVTIPLLAVVFTGAIFGFVRIGRSSDYGIYQLNFVEISGSNAWSNTYAGIFVPRQGNYSLTVPRENVAVSSSVAAQSAGEETLLRLERPPLWSVQRFYSSGPVEIGGGIEVKAVIDGAEVAVSVENNSLVNLTASYLRMGDRFYSVGPVAAGDAATATTQSFTRAENIFRQFFQSQGHWPWINVEQFLPEGLVYVGVAETDELQLIPGADETKGLNLVSVPLVTGDIEFVGNVDIPPGTLLPRVLGAVTQSNMGHDFYHYGQGEFEWHFYLPGNLDPAKGAWQIQLDQFWGDAEGQVLAYNYHSGQWVELAELTALTGRRHTAPRAARIDLEGMEQLVEGNRLLLKVVYDGDIGFNINGISLTVRGGGTR